MSDSVDELSRTALKTALAIERGWKSDVQPLTEISALINSVAVLVGLNSFSGTASFGNDLEKVGLVGSALREAESSLGSNVMDSIKLLKSLSEASGRAAGGLSKTDLELLHRFCIHLSEQIVKSRYSRVNADFEERQFEYH